MNPIQIKLIKETWQQVQPRRAAAAGLFYNRLFELAPEVQSMFRRDLNSQGLMLMAALNSVVAHIEHLDVLLPTVESLARRHVSYGVRPEHYAVVGDALLSTLEQLLEDLYTPEVHKAWSAAYEVLSSQMKRAAYPWFCSSKLAQI